MASPAREEAYRLFQAELIDQAELTRRTELAEGQAIEGRQPGVPFSLPSPQIQAEADPVGQNQQAILELLKAEQERQPFLPEGGTLPIERVQAEFGAVPERSMESLLGAGVRAVEPQVERTDLRMRARARQENAALEMVRSGGERIGELVVAGARAMGRQVPEDDRSAAEVLLDLVSSPRALTPTELGVAAGLGLERQSSLPSETLRQLQGKPSGTQMAADLDLVRAQLAEAGAQLDLPATVEGLSGVPVESPEFQAVRVAGGLTARPLQELAHRIPVPRAAALVPLHIAKGGATALQAGAEALGPERARQLQEEALDPEGLVAQGLAAALPSGFGRPEAVPEEVRRMAGMAVAHGVRLFDSFREGTTEIDRIDAHISKAFEGVDPRDPFNTILSPANSALNPANWVPGEQAFLGTTPSDRDPSAPHDEHHGKTWPERWFLASAHGVAKGRGSIDDFRAGSRALLGENAEGAEALATLIGFGAELAVPYEAAIVGPLRAGARAVKSEQLIRALAPPGSDIAKLDPQRVFKAMTGMTVAPWKPITREWMRRGVTAAELPERLVNKMADMAQERGLSGPIFDAFFQRPRPPRQPTSAKLAPGVGIRPQAEPPAGGTLIPAHAQWDAAGAKVEAAVVDEVMNFPPRTADEVLKLRAIFRKFPDDPRVREFLDKPGAGYRALEPFSGPGDPAHSLYRVVDSDANVVGGAENVPLAKALRVVDFRRGAGHEIWRGERPVARWVPASSEVAGTHIGPDHLFTGPDELAALRAFTTKGKGVLDEGDSVAMGIARRRGLMGARATDEQSILDNLYMAQQHGSPPGPRPVLKGNQNDLGNLLQDAIRSEYTQVFGAHRLVPVAGGSRWATVTEAREARVAVDEARKTAGLDLHQWTGDTIPEAQKVALNRLGGKYGRLPLDPNNPTLDDLNGIMAHVEAEKLGAWASARHAWRGTPHTFQTGLADAALEPVGAMQGVVKSIVGEGNANFLLGTDLANLPAVARSRIGTNVRKIERLPDIISREVRGLMKGGKVPMDEVLSSVLRGMQPVSPASGKIAAKIDRALFVEGATIERVAEAKARIIDQYPRGVPDRYRGLLNDDPQHQADAIRGWALDQQASQETLLFDAIASHAPTANPETINAALRRLDHNEVYTMWMEAKGDGLGAALAGPDGIPWSLLKTTRGNAVKPVSDSEGMFAWLVTQRVRTATKAMVYDLIDQGLAVPMPQEHRWALDDVIGGTLGYSGGEHTRSPHTWQVMNDVANMMNRYGLTPGFNRRWTPKNAEAALKAGLPEELVIPAPVLKMIDRAQQAGMRHAGAGDFAGKGIVSMKTVDTLSRTGTGVMLGGFGAVAPRLRHIVQNVLAIPLTSVQQVGFAQTARSGKAMFQHRQLVSQLGHQVKNHGMVFPGETMHSRVHVLGNRLFTSEQLARNAIEDGVTITRTGLEAGLDQIKEMTKLEGPWWRRLMGKASKVLSPQTVLDLGEQPELMWRLSTYIDRLEAGVGRLEAARLARAVVYNYADLSPVDRVLLRRVFGFWTFGRIAGDAFIRSAATHPERVGALTRFARDQGRAWGLSDAQNAMRRDVAAPILGVTADRRSDRGGVDPRLGGPDEQGRPLPAKLLTTADTNNVAEMLQVFRGMANLSPGETGAELISKLHPALGASAKVAFGVDPEIGAKITDPHQNIVPRWMMAAGFGPIFGGMLGLAPVTLSPNSNQDKASLYQYGTMPSVLVVGAGLENQEDIKKAREAWQLMRPLLMGVGQFYDDLDRIGAYRWTNMVRPGWQTATDALAGALGFRVKPVLGERAGLGRAVRARNFEMRDRQREVERGTPQ
ncbi:MAG: hypothetical protein GY788_21120 [bacterium]|nr:hypothetical protein [bacterium]